MDRQFTARLVSSMEKVLTDREPSSDGVRRQTYLLKGDTVSFQIAYFWNGSHKSRGHIEIAAPDWVNVRVRTVEPVPCAYPCHPGKGEGYVDTRPGLYPDLLRDLRPEGFPLVAGQWRALWIDMEAADDAPAGEAEAVFAVTGPSDAETICVPLTLIDLRLPALEIPHTEWFHCDCLADYYGVEVFSERHWEIVENFVRTAVKRGSTALLTPLFTPPLDTAVGGERRTVQLVDVKVNPDGGYSFSFDKLKRWIDMARACGVRWFEMSHLFTQWGAKSAPKIIAEMPDRRKEKIFGWETQADGDEYTAFLHAFLDALIPFLRREGVAENCLFHISDEPSLDEMDSYLRAKAIVKDRLKGFRMIDALSKHEFYECGAVDEPVCAVDHIEPFLNDRPERLWAYYCTSQAEKVTNRFIALPGYRERVLGLQLYKYRIDGFLHWGYNFYNSDYSLHPIDPYAVTDAECAFPSGDPFLVYPGADGKPEESIRLMLMDEAFSDLRALKLLETFAGREAAISCLEEDITFSAYPRSADYIARVREKVDRLLMKYSGGKTDA